MAVLVTAATAIAAPASALDKGRPMLCALGEFYECERGKSCDRVQPQEIGAPRFFSIDLANYVAVGVGPIARGRKSPIGTIGEVGPLLVMQGMDEAIEGQRGAIGWSASVSTSDGAMVLTAATEDGAFIIFGDCLVEE